MQLNGKLAAEKSREEIKTEFPTDPKAFPRFHSPAGELSNNQQLLLYSRCRIGNQGSHRKDRAEFPCVEENILQAVWERCGFRDELGRTRELGG